MSGPTLWRVLSPFTALHTAGYPADWCPKDAAGIGELAPLYDGYVLPRMAWPPGRRRLAEAWFGMIRQAGRFTVYDADDDIFTSDLSRRAVELGWTEGKSYAELEAERFERIWTMQQCDGVTVSTQRLATVVRSFTPRPVVVVPNAIDLPWFRRVLRGAQRRTDGITIGWAGGRRPNRDLAPMAEAWARIARSYPAVTFVVQGHVPAVVTEAVPSERLVILPWMPLERYPAGLVEVDIACASVADERFNRCKTPIKAYEAAVAGAAVVATPTVYGHLIEHEKHGYLAETADEWESALSALVARPALRAIMATRLLKVVERKHGLRGNLHRWPEAWSAIAQSARERHGRLVLA
jgi:glycosyltransferase involved in cell wall biosynthesis